MNAFHELVQAPREEAALPQVSSRRAAVSMQEEKRLRARAAEDALLPHANLAAPAREELRRCMENLLFALKGKTPCVVGFLSAQAGEGASSLAAALAVLTANDCRHAAQQLAEHERRSPERGARDAQVLLVDAHRRRPALARFFGVNVERGLSELLQGTTVLAEAVQQLPHPGLHLLNAGRGASRALSYFEIERLREILPELRTQFDFIFLDLPPVLHNKEAEALSALCDGVVFVVRAHHTRQEKLLAAQHALQQAGVNILGGVLNRRRFLIPNWLYKHL